MRPNTVAALALVLLPLACIAQTKPGDPMPPRSWVDKDTGHRVWRLSDEPNSGAFYFNINAYTPDEKQMIYSAPDGIHVLDMATRQTKLLVANPPQPKAAPGAAAPQQPVPGPSISSLPATKPTASSTPQPTPTTSPRSTKRTPTRAPSANWLWYLISPTPPAGRWSA
jgi:hypothetical protein